MISKPEQQQIRTMIQSPQWGAVEHVANELCDSLSYEPKTRETEWETLKATLMLEGQVRGIKRFIQELYNNAQQ